MFLLTSMRQVDSSDKPEKFDGLCEVIHNKFLVTPLGVGLKATPIIVRDQVVFKKIFPGNVECHSRVSKHTECRENAHYCFLEINMILKPQPHTHWLIKNSLDANCERSERSDLGIGINQNLAPSTPDKSSEIPQRKTCNRLNATFPQARVKIEK